ncbi:unnamed protein product [Strongylus vulgaris]|uniref:Uncharacterized protein n=1 Tax=Strongylus vulgaris TaxID=40348 RepID=A0A3P7KYC7_STRVU|nr:unnamed protein product [Strongylus vulgaris]
MQRTDSKNRGEVIGSHANRQDGQQMGIREIQRLQRSRTESKNRGEVIGSHANRQDGQQMGIRQIQRLQRFRTESKNRGEVIGSHADRQDGQQMGIRQIQRLQRSVRDLLTTNDECAITQLPHVPALPRPAKLSAQAIADLCGSKPPSDLFIQMVIVHEHWGKCDGSSDLAILELKQSLKSSVSICMPENDAKLALRLSVAGIGDNRK